jgi:hypothetical protein
LRRLDRAGVLPRGSDVARQSMPQEEIAALLAYADSVRGTNYLPEFRQEFRPARRDTLTSIRQTLITGFRWTKDLFAPGIGYDTANWSGARPRADERDYLYGFRLAAAFAPHFAVGADLAEIDDADVQLNVSAGYFGAWVGQRPLGYGVGNSGGLVLNAHTLLGGGVFLPKPLHLPALGPVRLEMHVSQIDNVLNLNSVERAIEPWFWTARLSAEPLNALRIGINRAMMFGGEGNVPVTFSRVVKNMLGIYTENSFANQVFSVDLLFRVPGAPLTAYFDWAADDAAGGWRDVPGLLAGVEYAHIDSNFDIAVGAEHVQFSGVCCSNSIWYRNSWFRGSWADGEDELGHPLGGHGREWRLFGSGSVRGGRYSGRAAVFARDRHAENIFEPAWREKSTGLQGGADVMIIDRVWLQADGEIEWGDADWSASRLSVLFRGRF